MLKPSQQSQSDSIPNEFNLNDTVLGIMYKTVQYSGINLSSRDYLLLTVNKNKGGYTVALQEVMQSHRKVLYQRDMTQNHVHRLSKTKMK